MTISNRCKVKGISMGVLGMVFMMNACSSPPEKAKPQYYGYFIGFLNKTGQEFDGLVDVYYGPMQVAGAGALGKGGEATFGPVMELIPSQVEVRWGQNGQRRSARVKPEGAVPERFAGTVYFVFNADETVDMKLIANGDDKAYDELMKGLRPEGEYKIGVANKTEHDLGAVSIFYGSQEVGFVGNVPAREVWAGVGYSDFLTLPIPPEVELRWTEDGTSHTVEVKLDGSVPKGYSKGTVFFVFTNAGTIEVTPIKWGDEVGIAELLK